MFKLLLILALIYAVLKFLNTKAKFEEMEAQREREAMEAEAAAEEEMEMEETAEEAVTVFDVETTPNDAGENQND